MSLSGPGPMGAFGMSNPLGQIVSGSGASSNGGPQPSSPSRMFGGSVVPPPTSGLDGGNGGTSSPFNPSMTAPSPSAVSQQPSTSMAHIEQIRQVSLKLSILILLAIEKTYQMIKIIVILITFDGFFPRASQIFLTCFPISRARSPEKLKTKRTAISSASTTIRLTLRSQLTKSWIC